VKLQGLYFSTLGLGTKDCSVFLVICVVVKQQHVRSFSCWCSALRCSLVSFCQKGPVDPAEEPHLPLSLLIGYVYVAVNLASPHSGVTRGCCCSMPSSLWGSRLLAQPRQAAMPSR
jgi:hypothetical protein